MNWIREAILDILERVNKEKPMVHIIPNHVTAAFTADITSAAGARPIMASAPEEAAEIAASASSLVINMGQPGQEKQEAMKRAISAAAEANLPVVLDPVGAGASVYRREILKQLLSYPFHGVIKGNYSEIRAMQTGSITHEGVDSINTSQISVSPSDSRVYAATGQTDIIFDKAHQLRITHLSSRTHTIVGTGCAAGALIGTFAAVAERPFHAAAAGILLMSYAEEKASQCMGYGTHKIVLLDAVSTINTEKFSEYIESALAEET